MNTKSLHFLALCLLLRAYLINIQIILVETSIFKIPQLCEKTQCTSLQNFMSHKKTTYLIYAYIYVSENLHSILQIQITNLNAAILDLF